MFRHRPMAMFASSSVPEDPKGPIRDWPVGYPAPMIGVWDGERKSCHILESFGANLLVPRNAKSHTKRETRHRKTKWKDQRSTWKSL